MIQLLHKLNLLLSDPYFQSRGPTDPQQQWHLRPGVTEPQDGGLHQRRLLHALHLAIQGGQVIR